MNRTLPSLALAVTLVISGSTGIVSAAGTDHPGRSVYLRYCGACHGPNAKGDGLAGTFMNPKPTDLTIIAKQNGGPFPFQQVMEEIDGTTTVRAHGDPTMPVWGYVFRDESTWDAAQRAHVRGRLMVITDYLQSIQQQ
jgi:mono/diheme cytochrome c family protein